MAAEFPASAAANAVGNLATEYASPYVSYFFRFGKIVEDFKNERKKLELKKDRVKNDVDAAINQTEVIEKEVQEWLKEAAKELEETQRLEVEIERLKCFKWCPNWGWRYCLSKKVAKKTPYITKLLQRSDFRRVGIRPRLQGIEFFTSKDFKSSKSSKLAFDGIMRALNTNGVNMIGLYGMPGVGKTTLATEVGRQAKEQKLFDDVVMVTMSQKPNISNIQDKIAGLLGLKFEASFQDGKAEELWRRLKGVKKILIIIDDVWDEFILQSIGIPFGVEHDGCKIFLTTRRQHVCVGMNCQEKFQLDILSEDEAWALFKDNAGLKDDSLALINEAKEAASECKGLPLAIVTIGKSLKGADLNGWRRANRRLKDSRQLDKSEGIYNCLKLSYDYLDEKDIQSCFLLCSLFPEDSDIGIEWLIRFGIGYGFFSDVDRFDVLRVEIREALRKLQESGLLLETDAWRSTNEIYVRMHDVVRDFAHWITLREEKAFMVKEGLTEWPIRESFQCCTSISFWKSDINNFPDKLEFPKLKMLVFEGKNSVRVPNTFVEGMKALQILHLKNISFSLEVIKIVRNLRTLCFEDCELENISSLKYLENLEILALLKTNIYELPEDLVELRRLKSLHFYFSRKEANFPPNLLSRLTSLQELHVACKNNVNLSELNSLSRLTALSLRVSTDQIFPENFVFPAKLQSFLIIVNEDYNLGFMKGLKFRSLEINNFSSSLSAFKELFCNAEELTLNFVRKHKNIVPSVDQKGLNELNILWIRRCNDMEYLMDTTRENRATPVFSNLVKLHLYEMNCLKELCHGPSPISFLQKIKDVSISCCGQLKTVFQIEEEEMVEPEVPPLSNLTYLRLYSLLELKWIWKGPNHCFKLSSLKVAEFVGCYRLKYLFSPSLAQSLVLLQQLKIEHCSELEHIITESDSGHLHPSLFPNLTSLEISYCERLKYLFSPSLAQGLVLLQQLKIEYCIELEHIVTESDSSHLHPQLFPNLTSLEISGCERLEYVIQIPLAQGLPCLKSLEITDAPRLKHVFNVLPCLQHLRLGNLINLSCFCSENYPIVSPSLERLLVRKCPQLEIFNIQQEGNKEIQLTIGNCNDMEYLMDTTRENRATPVFSNLVKLDLVNMDCLKELCHGPSPISFLQKLKHVNISFCRQLETVFQIEEEQMVEREVPPLSNLTYLQLWLLPELKWIWKGPNHCFKLSSLKVASFIGCDRLKYLFSPSLAQTLVSLQQLVINNCCELEHIITVLDSGHLHSPLFPNLTFLEISECERLEYVFQFPLAQGLPHLKSLEIINAPRLKHVFNVAQEKNAVDDVVALPCLQHLHLGNLINLSCFCSENYPIVSPSLESLSVRKCPQLEFFNIQQEGNKEIQLKELDLNQVGNECYTTSWEKIFQIQTDLRYLRELTVSCLNRLKFLFSAMVVRNLPQLISLEIMNCEALEEIIEMDQTSIALSSQAHLQPVSFPSLKRILVASCNKLKYLFCPSHTQGLVPLEQLKIEYCNGLEYVFQIPSTRGLPHLKSLQITDAPQLKQVFNVAKERNAIDHAVVFPHLQDLSLTGLINLSCFCSENYPIMLPSLERFSLQNCPQLKIFNIQQESNNEIQLKELYFDEFGYKCYTNSWGKIFQIQTEETGLRDIHQLKDPTQFSYFQYLRKLTVSHFNRLKFLFSAIVARNISQLLSLHILNCEELEEIIEMDRTSTASSSQAHLQPIPFPSLERIWIVHCNNLKCLFPISVIHSLSKLKQINIHGASELKQVFGYQSELNVDDDQKEIVFPALYELKLSELPSLNSFAPMGYHFQFPSLDIFEVTNCHKLTTRFSMDSEHPMHSVTEEPQQIQNDTTNDHNTIEEVVENQSTSNDMTWNRWDVRGQIPLYLNVGETRILLR